jgi:hypothetical protein
MASGAYMGTRVVAAPVARNQLPSTLSETVGTLRTFVKPRAGASSTGTLPGGSSGSGYPGSDVASDAWSEAGASSTQADSPRRASAFGATQAPAGTVPTGTGSLGHSTSSRPLAGPGVSAGAAMRTTVTFAGSTDAGRHALSQGSRPGNSDPFGSTSSTASASASLSLALTGTGTQAGSPVAGPSAALTTEGGPGATAGRPLHLPVSLSAADLARQSVGVTVRSSPKRWEHAGAVVAASGGGSQPEAGAGSGPGGGLSPSPTIPSPSPGRPGGLGGSSRSQGVVTVMGRPASGAGVAGGASASGPGLLSLTSSLSGPGPGPGAAHSGWQGPLRTLDALEREAALVLPDKGFGGPEWAAFDRDLSGAAADARFASPKDRDRLVRLQWYPRWPVPDETGGRGGGGGGRVVPPQLVLVAPA